MVVLYYGRLLTLLLAAREDHISISCCSNALLLLVVALSRRIELRSTRLAGDEGNCATGESMLMLQRKNNTGP